MNINQVRYFLAVCRERNFTRAAKHCGVAQPSLSTSIMRLEQELGGPLFHRGPTESSLSKFGHTMRPHLERLYQCVQDISSEAALLK